MKFLNKNNPWRPVYIACSLFFGIGYLLYFLAYFLPMPQWGRAMMTWAMPTVKALYSAERVGMINGTDPFPAQVVILYSALGSIALIAWSLFVIGCNPEVRQASLQHYAAKEKPASRTTLFFSGSGGALMWLACLYICFWTSASEMTWRDEKYYSSNIDSISFLLMAALFLSIFIFLSPLALYIAFMYKSFFKKG